MTKVLQKDIKILLIFPPVFPPFQPYLSLPSLTAFLRNKGYNVVQKDINIETFDALLTKEELQKSYFYILKKFIELKNKKKLNIFKSDYYNHLSQLIPNAWFIIDNIDKIKKDLRRKKQSIDVDKYIKNINLILQGLNLISAKFFPTKLTLRKYIMPYHHRSSTDIIKAIDDDKTNLFFDFFNKYTIPKIVKENPNLIGISIVGDYQIIPSFTLANLIKKKLPHVHITIGGPVFTLLSEEIKSIKELFSFIDSIILHEGEIPLLRLAEVICGYRKIKSVPNLIYYKQGKIYFNRLISKINMNSLPTPDYDGLPLNLYFSPHLVLSVQPSRGCYWRKCAFCNNFKIFNGYNIRKPSLVVKDIQYLIKRYKTKFFAFINESIKPKHLKQIASLLIKNNLNIKWYCGLRFEKEIDRQFCKLLKMAGCQKIFFGLESANQRILNLMEKGIKKEKILEILNYCHNQRIAVHLYCLIGFPTETLKESLETLKFIVDNKKILDKPSFSYEISCFQLKKYTKVSRYPHRYQLKVIPDQSYDLMFMNQYKTKIGLSPPLVLKMASFINERLNKIFKKTLLTSDLAHDLFIF